MLEGCDGGALKSLRSGLYLVGTPLGNKEDLSRRAVQTLKTVDLVACEDTRHAQKLLEAYDIKAKLTVYNDHSHEGTRRRLLARMQEGAALALISDAGMPLVSDPGYKLVRACWESFLYVTVIPGPSAMTAALALSGLPTDRFFFQGFLPRKGWQTCLKELAPLKATLVFFESSQRLNKTLAHCHQILGDRPLVIVREMTKLFEERLETSLEAFLAQSEPPVLKGEITFLLGRAVTQKELLKN